MILLVMGLSLEVIVLGLLVLTADADGVLELVAEEHEDDDAAELNAEVAPEAEGVSGEQGDRGGDHVGTHEGREEGALLLVVGVAVLVLVLVAEETEGDGANDLEDVSHVDRGELREDEGPDEGTNVGTDGDTEDDGVELLLVVHLVSDDTEDDEATDGAEDGLGEVDGDGGGEETGEARDQELHELGTEEGEGDTTTEVDEGGDLVGPGDRVLHINVVDVDGAVVDHGDHGDNGVSGCVCTGGLELLESELEIFAEHIFNYYLLIITS